MNWYKKAIDVFRGDTVPLKIQDFNVEHGTKQLEKELSSFAAGPGMYFTTTEEDASHYGQNITRAKINNANILSAQSKPLWMLLPLLFRNKTNMEVTISDYKYEDAPFGSARLIATLRVELQTLVQLQVLTGRLEDIDISDLNPPDEVAEFAENMPTIPHFANLAENAAAIVAAHTKQEKVEEEVQQPRQNDDAMTGMEV